MNTLPAQEIKRRGVKAIEQALQNGPVHIIKNNMPACVVLTEAEYANLTSRQTRQEIGKEGLLQWLLHKKASGTRTKEEIDRLLQDERDQWDQ